MKLFTAIIAAIALGAAFPAFASDATADRLADQRQATALTSGAPAIDEAPCACDCPMARVHAQPSQAERGVR